jgi:hypothetical protein
MLISALKTPLWRLDAMRKIFPILALLMLVSGCAVVQGLWRDSVPDYVGTWDAPDQTLILTNQHTFNWTIDEGTEAPRTQSGIYAFGSTEIIFSTGPREGDSFSVDYILFNDALTLGVGPGAIFFKRRTE